MATLSGCALKDSYRNALEQTIREMYEDRLKFDTLEVTRDDLIDLFIAPEHRQMVRISNTLYPWSGHHYGSVRVSAGNDMWINVGTNAPNNVLFPVYNTKHYDKPIMELQEDAPEETARKFADAVSEQLTIFQQYQRVFQVMHKLDAICASPSQMRFFWPAIEVLARHAALRDNKETLYKAVQANSKAPVPRISPQLRQACQDTSAVITAHQMMGKPPQTELLGRPVWIKPMHDVTTMNGLSSDFYRSL